MAQYIREIERDVKGIKYTKAKEYLCCVIKLRKQILNYY